MRYLLTICFAESDECEGKFQQQNPAGPQTI